MNGALIVVLFVTILISAANICLPKERRPPVKPDEKYRQDRHGTASIDRGTYAPFGPQSDEE